MVFCLMTTSLGLLVLVLAFVAAHKHRLTLMLRRRSCEQRRRLVCRKDLCCVFVVCTVVRPEEPLDKEFEPRIDRKQGPSRRSGSRKLTHRAPSAGADRQPVPVDEWPGAHHSSVGGGVVRLTNAMTKKQRLQRTPSVPISS